MVFDIGEIGLDAADQLVLGVGFPPPAADLSQPGHARAHPVTGGVMAGAVLEQPVSGARAAGVGARPDDRHITKQNV